MIITLLIDWQPAHEIGIPIIDEQHRGVVSAINSLHYCIRNGDAAAAYGPTMELLHHYTRLHFLTEEQLMKAAGYPEIESHMASHAKLIEQFAAMTGGAPDADRAEAVLASIKEWWLHHIDNDDQHYAAYIKRFLELP